MKNFLIFIFLSILAFAIPHCYGGAESDVGPPGTYIDVGTPELDVTLFAVPYTRTFVQETRSDKLLIAETKTQPTAKALKKLPYWPTACSISHSNGLGRAVTRI